MQTDPLEPLGAPEDDRRHVGQGLDVVEDGGLAEEAGYRRVRGTGTGHSPSPLADADCTASCSQTLYGAPLDPEDCANGIDDDLDGDTDCDDTDCAAGCVSPLYGIPIYAMPMDYGLPE
ncbi:MAG: hypothetical protein JW751_21475 [Polyangiaceae bacterium]|nr:hypothetical protein [Polyangiaceae bacterium]